MQFWNEMEGKSVAGRFVLGSLLRSAGRSAWFETQDEQQRPRVIVVTETINDDDQLLRNLQAAGRIHHPNVVLIETAGAARIDDKPVVYAVLEPTEENLGEVLRERALTPEETSQITESLVAGLGAIHAAGLAHGHVSPANILASGDTVKLRSDCLQTVSGDARAESFSQDTGDLGATVFESLTQRKLTSPQDAAIDKLPAPFRAIVKNSVGGDWGLAEIGAALKPGAAMPPAPVPVAKVEPPKPQPQPPAVKPAPAKPAPPPPPAAKPAPVAAAPAKLKPVPVVAAAPLETHDTLTTDTATTDTTKKGGSAVRVLAIIALVAALGLLWYFYRTTSRASDSAASASQPPTQTTASQAAAPASTPSTPPPAAAPAKPSSVHHAGPTPSHVAAPAAATASPAPGQQVWRVVVYAYGRQAEAEQKVDTMQAEHADLKPEVFSPNGHGPWLVTVGGPMSRSDALQLRGKVTREGLPEDSYAQNFTH